MAKMFDVGKLASNLLNSIDNAAKETLTTEEEGESASVIRSKRKGAIEPAAGGDDKDEEHSEEVERLHAECLDLERQVESLKEEVKRAWEAYRTVHERLTSQETELSQEISSLEEAKDAETKSLSDEITRLNNELEISHNRFDLLLSENKSIVSRSEELAREADSYHVREVALMEELAEAKACSSSNAAVTREQLLAAEATIEVMRKDHAAWMLQSHQRQEQLEQSNLELANSLTDAQRTIMKLKNSDEILRREHQNITEIEELRKQLEMASAAAEEAEEKHNEQSRIVQFREREMRALQLIWEDERKRYTEVTNKYAADIEDYKLKLSKYSSELHNGSTSSHGLKMAELEEQIKSLSQQLLKKQSNVQELLAERSAMKVRLHDLELRCTKAEEQAANMMYNDFEGDGDGAAEAYSTGINSGDGRGVLRRKNGYGGNGESSTSAGSDGGRNAKTSDISSDLERTYGVKPTPAVARAVNQLDTWAQLTGRYLRLYPMMRLAFVFYLLFLHLWAFVVLIFHTHSLEHDAFAPPKHPQ